MKDSFRHSQPCSFPEAARQFPELLLVFQQNGAITHGIEQIGGPAVIPLFKISQSQVKDRNFGSDKPDEDILVNKDSITHLAYYARVETTAYKWSLAPDEERFYYVMLRAENDDSISTFTPLIPIIVQKQSIHRNALFS